MDVGGKKPTSEAAPWSPFTSAALGLSAGKRLGPSPTAAGHEGVLTLPPYVAEGESLHPAPTPGGSAAILHVHLKL